VAVLKISLSENVSLLYRRIMFCAPGLGDDLAQEERSSPTTERKNRTDATLGETRNRHCKISFPRCPSMVWHKSNGRATSIPHPELIVNLSFGNIDRNVDVLLDDTVTLLSHHITSLPCPPQFSYLATPRYGCCPQARLSVSLLNVPVRRA
jgi:hypothetical protein